MGCSTCGGSKKSLNKTTSAPAPNAKEAGKVTVMKGTNATGGERTFIRNVR